MIVDLHTHSYYSDGVLSPKDIVMKALNAGCHFLSLTDHDSVEGLEEASIHSKDLSLNFIQGVEISAKHFFQSVHIVGLGINPNNKFLTKQIVKRIKSNNIQVHPYTINDPMNIKRMKSMGVDAIITDYPERINK